MAYTTETRTFVGETASAVGDGYAGFRVGRTCELQVERRDDDTVAIVLRHYLLAALLLAALASCTTQHLAQPTKHHQRVNQRSRDRNLHHDRKIHKRNFFDM